MFNNIVTFDLRDHSQLCSCSSQGQLIITYNDVLLHSLVLGNIVGSFYLACNERKAFFTASDQSRYTLWSCQNVCDALSYLLDNIYIRFGTK